MIIMEKTETIEKFKKFVLSMKNDDKTAIIHHTDADGVSSGIITAKAIERLGKAPAELVLACDNTEKNIESAANKIKKHGINKLIVTDIALDSHQKIVESMEKSADLLIIDHHKSEPHKFNKTVVVKPHMFSDISSEQYCASKMCYDLFSELTDISDLDWVCAVGITGDSGVKTWNDFLLEVAEKRKVKTGDSWFDTKFGAAAGMVTSAYAVNKNKGIEESFECFYNAKSLDDVLKSSIKKYHDVVDHEIERVVSNHKKEGEFYDDLNLLIYAFKSQYHIKSPVSNIISHKYYPDKTVIVLQIFDGLVGISARRQDKKVAMNDLIKQGVKNLDGGFGGGHVPASGGRVSVNDLERFKDNVIKFLKNSPVV